MNGSVLLRIQHFNLNLSDVIRKFWKCAKDEWAAYIRVCLTQYRHDAFKSNYHPECNESDLSEKAFSGKSAALIRPRNVSSHQTRWQSSSEIKTERVSVSLLFDGDQTRSVRLQQTIYGAEARGLFHGHMRELESPCQHLQTFESSSCVAAQRWHPSSRASACILVLLVSREDFGNVRAIFSSCWSILHIVLTRIAITASLI